MSIIDQALTAATVLLTEDHLLVECLSASRRGRYWFRPEEDFSIDALIVADHLDKVELEATNAANLCANAGLTALAECCKKIANRVALAKRQGTEDRSALDDLKVLTCDGQNKLDASCDIAAEYTRI